MTKDEAIKDAEYRAHRTGLLWHVIECSFDGEINHHTVSENGLRAGKHKSIHKAFPVARKGKMIEAPTFSSAISQIVNNLKRDRLSNTTTPTAKGSVIGFNVLDVSSAGDFGVPTTCKGTNNHVWIVLYKDVGRAFRVLKMTNQIQYEYEEVKKLEKC